MKKTLSAVMLLLMSIVFANTTEAKIKVAPKLYIFGFSASFKNAIVYLTNLQELDSAWVDSKSKFLCARDQYSAQLKDYLAATINDPHRTCVVMFSTEKSKAEKKYMKPFSFTPSHTIVLYTNYLPHVGGNDEGIWRRLIVIPFKATIAKRNDIKNYAQYLTEKAGPAVLQWIIEGAQRTIQQNYRLTTPAAVTKAVQAYHADNDWLGHFLNENCELDPSYEQKSGDLYQKYREYCQGIGEYEYL